MNQNTIPAKPDTHSNSLRHENAEECNPWLPCAHRLRRLGERPPAVDRIPQGRPTGSRP